MNCIYADKQPEKESEHITMSNHVWTDQPWLGFDTETTGVNVRRDHILTASLIDFDPRIPSDHQSHNWMINPGVKVPETSTRVHGLTTEDIIRDGHDPKQCLNEIATMIAEKLNQGIPLIVFNAAYDVILLDHNLQRWGLTPLRDRGDSTQWLIIDGLVISRALVRKYGKCKLTHMVDHYGVTVSAQLHNAEVDTLATLQVVRCLCTEFPELSKMSPAEMMQWQADKHTVWATGLNRWKQSRGYGNPVAETWELQRFLST